MAGERGNLTLSLPSPLPVESLRVEREGEGEGGGDCFGRSPPSHDYATQSPEGEG